MPTDTCSKGDKRRVAVPVVGQRDTHRKEAVAGASGNYVVRVGLLAEGALGPDTKAARQAASPRACRGPGEADGSRRGRRGDTRGLRAGWKVSEGCQALASTWSHMRASGQA